MNKDIAIKNIQDRIFTIRNIQVIIDRDLAEFYGVSTKVLNQAIKRNIKRFPPEFRFQLTKEEKNKLVTNCDRLKPLRHSSINSHVFTESGVVMVASVLHTDIAIKMSIKIVNAFVAMRQFFFEKGNIFQRLDNLEYKQLSYQLKTDVKFDKIFKALKESIILIDNFIDETVLQLFSKRKKEVRVKIYTKKIAKTLKLDLKKFNSQHPSINIEEFSDSHDKFLLINNQDLCHIGASLKDLGKKWFAFSKMSNQTKEVLSKLG